MNTHRTRKYERGQIVIYVVLVLGLALLGFGALATDYSRFWFARQSVQGAADAVCQAGAMDLLLYALGGQGPNMNFDPAMGAFACSSNPTAAPCIVGTHNGIGSSGPSTVNLSFPTTISGVTPPSDITYPYIQVDVLQSVPRTFSKLFSGQSTAQVGGHATCGLDQHPGPVPIVVLHPTAPANVADNHPNSIYMAGSNSSITVKGGPQVSVQVNSKNIQAVTSGSLAAVDLSQGGPHFTGADFAVFGGQAQQPPSGFSFGSTGHWRYPYSPIADPYRLYSAPIRPIGGTKHPALKGAAKCPTGSSSDQMGCYKRDGCPDVNGCDEYEHGFYPAVIQVKNGTAVFQPGQYYLGNGLNLDSNSTVRVACCGGTADGDGSGGVMFYFKGTGTLNVSANSGKPGLAALYYVAGGTNNGIQSRALQCPGGDPNPVQIPATIDGNMLVGPCTGTYADPSGHFRGFLFFQDRSAAAAPQWQGGGSTLASGFMYFHQCKANGTGVNCSAPLAGGYGTTFNLGGNPGSASYTIGSIVTDRININGNPGITMILSPYFSFPQLYVTMYH